MSAPNPSFNRPPRLALPSLPDEVVEIPAPSSLPPSSAPNLWLTYVPIASVGLLGLFTLVRAFSAGDASALWSVIPFIGLALLTVGGLVAAGRQRKLDAERRALDNEWDYRRLLERKRARLQAAHDAEGALLRLNYPSPYEGLQMALGRSARLWERRPSDADFLRVRVGIGETRAHVQVQLPPADSAPASAQAAFQLADEYRLLRSAPLCLSLRLACVGVYGERDAALGAVRAMLCHVALFHAPAECQVHLIASEAARPDWEWLEWLPHTSYSHRGGAGDLVAFGEGREDLLQALKQTLEARKTQGEGANLPILLLMVDGEPPALAMGILSQLLREGAAWGIWVLWLEAGLLQLPSACRAVLGIASDGSFELANLAQDTLDLGESLDALSRADAESLARALANLSSREGERGRIPRRVDFLELYSVGRIEDFSDLAWRRWRRPVQGGVLPFPVPVGREGDSAVTELWLDDEHEGAHGVLAGTTGSGKSELLQTLICALALEHHPRLLNFLLIDFKGGSAFSAVAELPHVVGMVTNLDGGLVARALEALRAEVRQRQTTLKALNLRDVTQYHRRFSEPSALDKLDYAPLPHLFVIVDEFAQLARQMPDFLRELVQIAQLGRSLGIHLILGTQSPMDVISDEMNDNLQFRLCLRVQNVEASRAMLKRPDAAYLPQGLAGRAYLQVGERGTFKLFQAAYVGAEYSPQTSAHAQAVLELTDEDGQVFDLFAYDSAYMPPTQEQEQTLAHALARLLARCAEDWDIPAPAPLLLPPLPERLSLERLLNNAERQFGSAVVGMSDDLSGRRQELLRVYLLPASAASPQHKAGHWLVLGAPSMGKTSALQSLALALAQHHHPEELQLYVLAFGGREWDAVSRLPHAERVVYSTESERARRLFRRLLALLEARQAGRTPTQPLIVGIVDGFEAFRDTYYEQHFSTLERLISEGRGVGMFVALSANSIGALPERLRTLMPQRFALNLSSPSEMLLALGQVPPASSLSEQARGRGYVHQAPPLLAHLALSDDAATVAETQRRAYAQARGVTLDEAQAPMPLRELPTRLSLSLPDAVRLDSDNGQLSTCLGVWDDDALTPLCVDWDAEGGLFVVSGAPASGKTSVLAGAALAAAWHLPPSQLRYVLMDVDGRGASRWRSLPHVVGVIDDLSSLEQHMADWQAEGDAYQGRTVLWMDDFDLAQEVLSASPAWRILRDKARLRHKQGVYVWAAGAFERVGDPLARALTLRRVGFELLAGNRPLSGRPVSRTLIPVGRAQVTHGQGGVVQFAHLDDLSLSLAQVRQRWHAEPPAAWLTKGQMNTASPSAMVQALPTAQGVDVSSLADIDVQGLIADLFGESAESDAAQKDASDDA